MLTLHHTTIYLASYPKFDAQNSELVVPLVRITRQSVGRSRRSCGEGLSVSSYKVIALLQQTMGRYFRLELGRKNLGVSSRLTLLRVVPVTTNARTLSAI